MLVGEQLQGYVALHLSSDTVNHSTMQPATPDHVERYYDHREEPSDTWNTGSGVLCR